MPTQSESHVDSMLTNVAVAAFQDNDNFIASKVFPDVPVEKQSDRYAVIPAGDYNRDEMQKRADATESSGSDFTLSTDAYFCDVWAHHTDIGDQTKANADAVYQVEASMTRFLTMKALVRKEKEFVSKFYGTGIWDQQFTPSVLWDATGSEPVKEVRAAITRQGIVTGGYRPNVIITTQPFIDALLQNEDILNRVTFNAAGGVADPTIENLRQLFQVDEILITNAIENTKDKEYVVNQGDDTSTPTKGRKVPLEQNRLFASTNSMLLLYRTPSPGMYEPTAGYSFSWSGLTGQAGMGMRMMKYDLPLVPNGTRLEVEIAFDMKVQASHFGTFFTGCFGTDPLDLAGNGMDGDYTVYGEQP